MISQTSQSPFALVHSNEHHTEQPSLPCCSHLDIPFQTRDHFYSSSMHGIACGAKELFLQFTLR